MKPENTAIQNTIWHSFFIRSANSFVFDLLDETRDLKGFSLEQIYNMVAVFDNVAAKATIFKEELKKRVGE
jgi:hypothetical protein